MTMTTAYDELPLIPLPALSRAAGVHVDTGRRVLAQLTERGEVCAERSPRGRTMLSPSDGRRVYDAILGTSRDLQH